MHIDYGHFEEKQLGKPYDVKLLGRLYPYTKPYKLLLLSSIVLIVLLTLLDLSLPYVTKIAIDRYIVPGQKIKENKMVVQDEDKIRTLKADMADPQIESIVRKYSDLFKVEGSFALISFRNLNKLDKNDLSILRKSDLSGVTFITAVFLAIVIFNFVLNIAQVLIMEYAGQMVMHDLRVHLFKHIQSLSVAFFTRNPVGRLVTRVTNDIQNMHELFTSVIAFVFKDLFLLVGIAVVLMGIHLKLALVSFMVIPFVLYASLHFSGQAREAYRTLRIKIAEINTRFSETIGGIKVIQLFLQEKQNYLGFKNLNHEHYLAGMKQIHVFAIFMPVIEILGAAAIAVVIFYGGGGVLSGTISLGALVAFLSYMKMFFRPIRDIAEKYNILQNSMASAERIFLILDNSETIQQPAADIGFHTESKSKPLGTVLDKISEISMEKVSFEYVKNEPVLKNISFSIKAGETLAVVGPTGSGKTSIINLIIRFYDPTSGRVLLNGVDIKENYTKDLRAKMALVMQDPFLFSDTIRENITLGGHNLSESTFQQILQDSNCKTLVDRLPEGVHTVLSEGGTSISSGERQLISIARAFARNPDLIILDEATSYIDSETEVKIQEALTKLMSNRTSIIVAHRLSTAREADKIIVLNRGQIIETGNHSELMKIQGFYYRLNQLQG
ncbi:MAG: ABC transporter ATP-binding protein/permease [Desulfobacteraceae bacterium]|nr:ABC transporter ATP-binding protein/permease [Desulfobacteraceae bacterium]